LKTSELKEEIRLQGLNLRERSDRYSEQIIQVNVLIFEIQIR